VIPEVRFVYQRVFAKAGSRAAQLARCSAAGARQRLVTRPYIAIATSGSPLMSALTAADTSATD
jgi:hypothetical protein